MKSSWLIVVVLILAVGAFGWVLVSSSHPDTADRRDNQTDLETQTSADGRSLLEIPFTLTEHNNISIDVVLNGQHSLKLMFHTGNHDVCLTEAATEKIADLKFDGHGDVNSWGGSSTTSFCTGNALRIGDQDFDDITVFEDRHSGHGTDGKFGPDLFLQKAIEINFDRKVLVIHDTLPEIAESYQQFACRQHRSSLFIKGNLQVGDQTLPHEFMIHSGFSGTVLLDGEFVSLNDLDQLETISESELLDSFGNVLKSKKVMLPKLVLGKSSLSNVPIGFFDGMIGKQQMSVVGGDVLKRFDIIIGPCRANVYLRPNDMFDLEFGT